MRAEVARFGDTPVVRAADAAEVVARVVALAGESRLHWVVDENVSRLHADSLRAAGGAVDTGAVVASGEASKSVTELARLWSRWVLDGIQRDHVVVAVGGGVTTDLAGFAASTVLRGVRWIAVSTTVLGMADAAIGGKTGIDLPEGKNLAGTFAPPMQVVLWTGALATLPPRELRAGLAEVVKTAWLEGESAVRSLEAEGASLVNAGSRALWESVERAAAWKCDVVTEDPTEQGRRRVLNFGHTFGHAVEAALGPERVVHGEAVAIGLRMALEFSEWLGASTPGQAARMVALLRKLSLPVDPPRLPLAHWMAWIARDKKAVGAGIRFVHVAAPGRVRVEQVALEKFALWLQSAKVVA